MRVVVFSSMSPSQTKQVSTGKPVTVRSSGRRKRSTSLKDNTDPNSKEDWSTIAIITIVGGIDATQGQEALVAHEEESTNTAEESSRKHTYFPIYNRHHDKAKYRDRNASLVVFKQEVCTNVVFVLVPIDDVLLPEFQEDGILLFPCRNE